MVTTIVLKPTVWNRPPLSRFFLALVAFSGLSLMTGNSTNMVTQQMDKGWSLSSNLWGGSLFVGALIALLGIYWPSQDKITAMVIEKAGVFLLGGASLIWTVSVFWLTRLDGIVSIVTTIIFSGACFFQVRYVDRIINDWIAQLEAGSDNA